MLNITKADVKMRCRICLIKVMVEEELELNEDLKNFEEYIHKYPQNLCFNCFDKLQETNKFLIEAQKNAEVLYDILKQAEAIEQKLKLPNIKIDAVHIPKDIALMESESIILDNTIITQADNAEINNLDPFNIELLKPDNKSLDALNTDTEISNFSDEPIKLKTKPTFRNKAKQNITKTEQTDVLSDDQQIKRKKRRSKKEMEEYLREKYERMKRNNIKRRQKGTRNAYKCLECSHRFGHKLNLDAHIRKVHEGQTRAYHCDQCEKTYCHSTGLFNHIKDVHETKGETFLCDVPDCGRTYTSYMAFQYHQRVGHMDEVSQRRYVCEQCGATFNLSAKLLSHRKKKHPTEAEILKREQSEPLQCEICKNLFKNSQTLKNHKRQFHSESRFECEICKEKFRQNASLLYHHQLIHTTEKIPCLSCEKVFVRKYDLQKHVRAVHMKIKPFQCKYCSESFASGKTRRHHEYIHTGEKPYVCDICGKAYRQPTCLKNHRKTHDKIGICKR